MKDPRPLLAEATAAFRASDHARCANLCERALAMAPGIPPALNLLGLARKHMGDMPAALDALGQAAKVAPDYAPALVNYGNALRESGSAEKALEPLKAAIQSAPQNAGARIGLAKALQDIDEQEEAVTVLTDAARAIQDAGILLELGNARQSAGQLQEATDTYNLLLARQPDHAGALSNLAAAYLKLDNAAAALEVCDRFLTLGQRSANVVAYRSQALWELGRDDEANALSHPDEFVFARDLDYGNGYASREDFNAAFIADIRNHPTLTREWDPKRRAARGGAVTADLLSHPTDSIRAYEAGVRKAVDAIAESLPAAPGHPFYDARPAQYRVVTWANIMLGDGHQSSHIHNLGWISGVYYPALPSDLGHDESDPRGWICFGDPGYGLPANRPPLTRFFRPGIGGLFMFPSYLWHATVPHGSGEERISVAFDILPVA